MKRRYHYPAATVLVRMAALAGLLLLAASCIREQMEEELPAPQPPQSVEVKLHLRASRPAGPTRGLTVERENLINDVYVFFLNTAGADAGKVYAVVKGESVTGTPDPSNWTFTASLSVDAGTTATFDCMVLANAQSWMTANHPNLADFKGKTVNELQGMLVSAATVPTDGTPTFPPELPSPGMGIPAGTGMVMWGKAAAPVSVTGTPGTASISVPVVRALASVEIGVGKGPTSESVGSWPGWDGSDASGNSIPFELKEVYVYRANNQYAFMPVAANYAPGSSGDSKVTAPSPAGTVLEVEHFFKYNVTGYGLRREIYLPEADIKLLNAAGTGHTGKPGDAGHTDRCALVVGGMYNGKLNYYRIDFNDNAAGTGRSLIDLLRNHRYYVSIISVNGEGETTPQKAYESLHVNLGIEVTGWTPQYQDVIFDGADWMYVEKREITLPGNKEQSGSIRMESTIPPAEWEMSFDEVNFDKVSPKDNGVFRVTKPDAAKGSLTITTLQAMAENAPDNNATLTIKARNLRFTIAITQKPDKHADWEQGGGFDKPL